MTDTDVAVTHATGTAEAAKSPPRLADGLELIGEFADSGFRKAPFIARRADGQMVQMPRLLYRLALEIDGRAGYDKIAQRYSQAIQRSVSEADVRMLVEERLRPLGIVAPEDPGATIRLEKLDPLLALKFRVSVVSDGAVRALTTLFRPLFLPPVMVAAVLAAMGIDGWLFFVHGISQSLRHTLYQPALMLMLIGGVILATAFHEIGHATACRYGGARPGVMGMGIYIVWPAFYTDITDAYRLGRWGRLRADIGGMYFNALFALAATALYAVTSFEPLLLLVVLQNIAIMQQALPLLRLDGYYILSDLTGVPDIFLRIGPILASLLPGRATDPRVAELKPRVRVVVTVYVVFIVLFLAVTGLALVINLPRILATAYSSASAHFTAVGPAFGHGGVAQGVLDIVQGLFLVLPGIGLVYTTARVLHRAAVGAVRWSRGQPGRRAVLALAGSAGVALAALSWWPNGEYRPIQPGERGTVPGLLGQVGHLPSARPSLTGARARQLGLSGGGAGDTAGAETGSAAGSAGSGSGGTETLGARLRIHHHPPTTSITTPPSGGATGPSSRSAGPPAAAPGLGQTSVTTTGSSSATSSTSTTSTTSTTTSAPATTTTTSASPAAPAASTPTTTSSTTSSAAPASAAPAPATTTSTSSSSTP